MVDIAYLVPGVGLDEEELDRRERIANEIVPESVTILEAGEGPLSIESTVEEEWSVMGVMRTVDKYAPEFDAFVIGCFGDPGIVAARELVETPVVGPASASFHTAAQIADSFSCLTILDSVEPLTRRVVHENHLDSQLASIRVVEAPVLEIDHESDALVEDMISTGRKAIEEDDAQALVPGCMSLSFMQEHDHIANELGVPFIDPVTVSLETASMYARHGITHSSKSYPTPKRDKLDNLLESEHIAADD